MREQNEKFIFQEQPSKKLSLWLLELAILHMNNTKRGQSGTLTVKTHGLSNQKRNR